MSRAQLKHVLLDVDFLNNPKVRTLKTKFSHLSQLCLIDIYSAMSKATNAIIDRDCLESILAEYGVQIEFIDYCVERGLIQKETSGYTNSVVIKDQEQYYRKLNSGKNKSNSEQNFPEKIQEKSTPDIDSDYDNESKNKLRLPVKFNTPEIKTWVTNWRDKLRKAGRIYDQIQLEANCMNFNTPEAFLAALKHSCGLSKTYNLYSPPDKEQPKNKDKPASISHAESIHPAVRAQRERDAKEALEKLGMGGLAK